MKHEEVHEVPLGGAGPPSDPDEATVTALGKLSEALEVVEEARGQLYGFHRRCGMADLALGEAVDQFRDAGHPGLADRIEEELLGRNVLAGRWSYQIVEEYDEGYYRLFKAFDETARNQLASGRRHLYEAAMKESRRSRGARGHEAAPEDVPDP